MPNQGSLWQTKVSRGTSPEHGEHTESVLKSLGLSDAQIAGLAERGAINNPAEVAKL